MIYTIGEVSAMLKINPSTLRYYDKEGILPFLNRNDSGVRQFSENDFGWLHIIECLKSTGMSIKDIKQFLDWALEGESTLEKRRDMFYERKKVVLKQMEELQKTLDTIEFKCWFYDTAVEHNSDEYVKNIPDDEMPPRMLELKNKLYGYEHQYLTEEAN